MEFLRDIEEAEMQLEAERSLGEVQPPFHPCGRSPQEGEEDSSQDSHQGIDQLVEGRLLEGPCQLERPCQVQELLQGVEPFLAAVKAYQAVYLVLVE